MQIDCEAVREDIDAWALGALGDAESRAINAHLNLATVSLPAQTGHSDRSDAAFSSSFAPANEPRRAVEEPLFD